MNTTVVLDQKHFQMLMAEAKATGQTPEEFLHSLIDARARSFDEILEPLRKGFERTSDKELNEMFDRARKDR